MAPLMKLFKSGPRGPPGASHGPPPTHKAYARQDDLQDVAQGLTRVQLSAWPTNRTTYAAETTAAHGQSRLTCRRRSAS